MKVHIHTCQEYQSRAAVQAEQRSLGSRGLSGHKQRGTTGGVATAFVAKMDDQSCGTAVPHAKDGTK
ncbi:hypothetical protein CHUAL_009518 [Chamberlinius hualienensis]